MSRILIDIDPEFQFSDHYIVPDGCEFRAHDAVLVLEAVVAQLRKLGPQRFPTGGEQVLLDKAQAVLSLWEPIGPVSVEAGGHVRPFVKSGHTEHVSAPCREDGAPTILTADALAKWEP